MTLLNQMTIKTRMMLSGLFMVVLFLAFGLIFITQMNKLADLTATLYDHPLKVSNAALRAKIGVIRMQRGMKDVSISPTRLSANLAIQAVLDEEKTVYAELATIRNLILGDEGKSLVEEVVDVFSGWKPIRLEVEELVLKGDLEAANKITRNRGADYVARLERKLAVLTTYAIKKADGFMADARTIEDRILNNAILFILIMALTSLGVGSFISSSILSSVSTLKDTMTGITESSQLKEVRLDGKNEITEMADHFNGLIRRLKGQFWLRDGGNTLNKDLSGELTHSEILDKSIRTVCRYTHACAGAIYRFNPEEDTCELKSTYALVESNHMAGHFSLGHGIVGQVALEKRPILLTHISKADARGQSGTVNEAPDTIYAIPLVYQDRLYGVMETASFSSMDILTQRYLESAAETIAVSLHTAVQGDRIRQLLDSSQTANERLKDQARELQNQTEELTALNEESQQQSHELRTQNLALEAQQSQVEEANRLKSEFLSNMSHELRTPLNSVNALSKVLMVQAKDKLTQEELEYLTIIERNGNHLLALINDILDLSKIEAGRMEVIESEFSLTATVDSIIEGLAPIAREKEISLKTDQESGLPRMISDETRVIQILQNIIANAVKFTEKGWVHVSTQMEKDGVCIRVQDTGIGISARDLDGIFEKFRQADGASTRKFEGTGLGLSIAHKAATLLGGDIQVDSIPDKGTTFSIYLPLRYTGPESLPAASGVEPTLKKYNPSPDAAEKQKRTPSPSKSPGLSRKTILLAEDNEAAVIQVKAALARLGCSVDIAKNGQQALDLIGQNMPDGIILDLMMPKMDGFQFLESIRNAPETREIPVLILTAKDLTKEDRSRLKAFQARHLIQKGNVDQDELIDQIRGMMGAHPSRPTIKPVPKAIEPGNTPLILVIEDNPDNMVTIKAVLGRSWAIIGAADGKQGLAKATSILPDLILLDMSLPLMDGFSVVDALKADERTKHIPVIALTAQAMKGDREKMIAAGCDDYLSKPIDSDAIMETLAKWVILED